MAASRQYFTDKEIDLIITYFEELRDSQPDFYAALLGNQVTGRFFFEIRSDKTHPKKAGLEGVDSSLDLAFKNSPVLQTFNEDMQKLMRMFLDVRLSERYQLKVEGMIGQYSKGVMASDKWDAILKGLSDKEQERIRNLISTGILFKLLAVWGFKPEFIKGYDPRELMNASKLIREICAVNIGEVGKKEIAEKLKAQTSSGPQQQKAQDLPMTEQEKEHALLLEFQQKFHSRKTPEEKAKWADKFLDFLLKYHKGDFAETVKPNDERALLLTLAKEAFANVAQLAPKHKELYALHEARQGEIKEKEKTHKAKAEKFFGEAIKEDKKTEPEKGGSKAERFFGEAVDKDKKNTDLEKVGHKYTKK
jgi:hypothetical protein